MKSMKRSETPDGHSWVSVIRSDLAMKILGFDEMADARGSWDNLLGWINKFEGIGTYYGGKNLWLVEYWLLRYAFSEECDAVAFNLFFHDALITFDHEVYRVPLANW